MDPARLKYYEEIAQKGLEPERKKRRIGFDVGTDEEEISQPKTSLELLHSMPVERLRLDRTFSGPLTFSIAEFPDDEDHDDF